MSTDTQTAVLLNIFLLHTYVFLMAFISFLIKVSGLWQTGCQQHLIIGSFLPALLSAWVLKSGLQGTGLLHDNPACKELALELQHTP